METKKVTVEHNYNAPIQKVWDALTRKEQLKKWYFDLDDFKPETGFQFSFKGQGHKGESYTHLCMITEVIPLRKLQYSWKYEDYPGESLVTFELFEQGDATLLRLTHTGLDTFPYDNPDFAPASFNEGWNMIIGKLLPEFLAK